MLTLFLSSQRYNPVEQWIPEVVSIEAPSIVVELHKWRYSNAPDLLHCRVPTQPQISNSPFDPKTIA
ncbi:hypothetical protein KY290_024191 [Solanum tuberosum]|uniref:Uncharacterized protein n=1 Tax=Solanum tuberosum TaxID=4113 RepID=A0ABQ7US14_SOLTU|nr:hypothetical protein KY289_023271 [Solanum tuberosum]KAH0753921.1 hypothetical protein KY290_024191 [Solanum tuberosum]